MQPIEIHFKFENTDELDYHIITNAKKFYQIIKDTEGWIDKTVRNNDYIPQDLDKGTLEYVRSKIHEISMSYGITI